MNPAQFGPSPRYAPMHAPPPGAGSCQGWFTQAPALDSSDPSGSRLRERNQNPIASSWPLSVPSSSKHQTASPLRGSHDTFAQGGPVRFLNGISRESTRPLQTFGQGLGPCTPRRQAVGRLADTCCASHHHKEARSWTKRQATRPQETTWKPTTLVSWVVRFQVGGWQTTSCTAVGRLISTRTGPCCSRCHPTFNGPANNFKEQPFHRDASTLGKVLSTRVLLRTHIRKAAQEAWTWCPSLKTTLQPGQTCCACRSWSFDGKEEASRTANAPQMTCGDIACCDLKVRQGAAAGTGYTA